MAELCLIYRIFSKDTVFFIVYSLDNLRLFPIMLNALCFSTVFNLVVNDSNCGASITSAVYIINLNVYVFAWYCSIKQITTDLKKTSENYSFLIPVNDCSCQCYVEVCNDFCQRNSRLNLINEYHYLLMAKRICLYLNIFPEWALLKLD